MRLVIGPAIVALCWPVAAAGQNAAETALHLEVRRGKLRRASSKDPLEHVRSLPQRRPEEGRPGPHRGEPGTQGRRRRRGDRAGQARGEPALREGRGRRDASQAPARRAADRGGSESWIAAAAPYPVEPVTPPRAGPDWWSLQPIRTVAVPTITGPDASLVRTPIDAFILAKLKEKGLEPGPRSRPQRR